MATLRHEEKRGKSMPARRREKERAHAQGTGLGGGGRKREGGRERESTRVLWLLLLTCFVCVYEYTSMATCAQCSKAHVWFYFSITTNLHGLDNASNSNKSI